MKLWKFLENLWTTSHPLLTSLTPQREGGIRRGGWRGTPHRGRYSLYFYRVPPCYLIPYICTIFMYLSYNKYSDYIWQYQIKKGQSLWIPLMKPSSDYPFLYVRSMCNSWWELPLTYLTVTVLYRTSSSTLNDSLKSDKISLPPEG